MKARASLDVSREVQMLRPSPNPSPSPSPSPSPNPSPSRALTRWRCCSGRPSNSGRSARFFYPYPYPYL